MVPMFAFLCNLFLFVTLTTVKKNNSLSSFVGLLGVYLVVTLGSFLMRLGFFPGGAFWYRVMLVGLSFVPYCYYCITLSYLGLRYRRQKQLRFALAVIGAVLLSFTDVFTSAPVIQKGEGDWHIAHVYHWPIFLLMVLALALVLPAIFRLYREGKTDAAKRSGFRAVAAGMLLLAAGMAAHSFTVFRGFPFDTLVYTLNALAIYYVLYKRRVNRSDEGVSRGVLYLLWMFIVFVLIAVAYETADTMYNAYLSAFLAYKEVALTLFFALVALCVFLLIDKLYRMLFEKEKELRSSKLKEFSLAASKLMSLGDLVNALTEFLLSTLPTARAYVFLQSPDGERYACAGRSAGFDRRMEFSAESRFADWLKEQNDIVSFADFKRTTFYAALSTHETRILGVFDTALILPHNAEGKLLGFTLLSGKNDRKKFSGDDKGMLASVLPVVSIALRNANLYEEINREAQRDAHTGLYNRRYFMERLESDINRSNGGSLSVLLFNLDDFRLYNEVYGSDEGDAMLVEFAGILAYCIKGNATIARYACNEFAVSLPYADADTAEKYARKVKAKLAEHLGVSSDPTMFLAFSAGICCCPQAAQSARELMGCASLAVRRAKSDGKNRIVVYLPQLFAHGDDPDERAAIIQQYTSTIYALTAAIDAKDHYTFNHSLSVSHYAATLAQAAGMGEELVEAVRQAGLLHDIGKISIPDEILTKAGKLNDAEFCAMRKHVERSVEMIRHLPALSYVTPLVLGHHERYDGGGYPRAIAGDCIPLGARCLTIADSFDAMISQRSYKTPMPVTAAIEEIRVNLGKQFDPSLGRLFISLVEDGAVNIACY